MTGVTADLPPVAKAHTKNDSRSSDGATCKWERFRETPWCLRGVNDGSFGGTSEEADTKNERPEHAW